ncbi:hypothetical protein BJ508DRAFT_333807 [Ascobolus immersus RN42]|uniref:Uncharacterized protein n=1 Tax=Ascobolus immersus RN42 TaxID=1160509 RepID=A0A3N4HVJ1_ASCIM|nr:hypothetical protein BJ508DRAFT_333807 [Ascobolus immersus RN42]
MVRNWKSGRKVRVIEVPYEIRTRIERLKMKRNQLRQRIDLLNERQTAVIEAYTAELSLEGETFPHAYTPLKMPPWTPQVTPANIEHCERELVALEGQFERWRTRRIYFKMMMEATTGKYIEQQYWDVYYFAKKEGWYKGKEPETVKDVIRIVDEVNHERRLKR